LRIDDLAAQVNMSTSTFHHHFRALTAMSPLQYQNLFGNSPLRDITSLRQAAVMETA
jgi:AraC-like DNA-binding protein